MIVLNLKLNNIYGFSDFNIDFSYPKKIVKSLLEDEFLEGRPNFRYKKAVILMGANATGKTSLGKALLNIVNFINSADPAALHSLPLSSEKASFQIDFVNIGYIPDSGAVYLVTRAVGTVKASELFLSGRRFSGREAADMGLVTVAVPEDQLEETVSRYVEKYAKGPTVAYGYIKTMMNRTPFHDYAVGMESEIEYQGICEQTEDHKEAVNAFFEKRRPEFRGK